MTPDQIIRAGFLLKALKELNDAMHPPDPKSHRLDDMQPIGLGAADATCKLQMADYAGNFSNIAHLDRELVRVGVLAMITAVKAELRLLGVDAPA